MESLLAYQVAPEPIGCRVGKEDNTLGETVTSPVDVSLLQGCLVWSIQLRNISVHKIPLLAKTSDGANVIERFT